MIIAKKVNKPLKNVPIQQYSNIYTASNIGIVNIFNQYNFMNFYILLDFPYDTAYFFK